jgi:hypothetical protein
MEKCSLCGVERDGAMLGVASDHLRVICVTDKRPLVLDRGYFTPRLHENEAYVLQRGEQYVCSNRKACRARQADRRLKAAVPTPRGPIDPSLVRVLRFIDDGTDGATLWYAKRSIERRSSRWLAAVTEDVAATRPGMLRELDKLIEAEGENAFVTHVVSD